MALRLEERNFGDVFNVSSANGILRVAWRVFGNMEISKKGETIGRVTKRDQMFWFCGRPAPLSVKMCVDIWLRN